MYDPRDTRPHDFDTTVMGPGFFIFFNYGIIESGGYIDYGTVGERARFKAAGKEEKRAKPIIEEIAEKIDSGLVDNLEDLEITLRLRLAQRELQYKALYKTFLEQEFQKAKKKRQQKRAVSLLLLT